jgi:hypothetical protein
MTKLFLPVCLDRNWQVLHLLVERSLTDNRLVPLCGLDRDREEKSPLRYISRNCVHVVRCVPCQNAYYEAIERGKKKGRL